MEPEYPTDPLLDPVAIFEWGIDAGVFGFMNTAWGWPVTEVLHFFGLCLLVGSVGAFDLVMIGAVRGIRLAALHRLVPFGVAGFALSVVTGALFVIAAPDQYLYNPAFQIKMGLLAVAGANMALFYLTTARRVAKLAEYDRPPLAARLFAAVSLASWFGVIMAGRVITAFRPPSWFWCAWC